MEVLDATFHVNVAHISPWTDPLPYLMTHHSNLACFITVLGITIPSLICILMVWDRLTKPTIVKQIPVSTGNVRTAGTTNFKQFSSNQYDKDKGTSPVVSRYDQARQRLKNAQNKSQGMVSEPMQQYEKYDDDQESHFQHVMQVDNAGRHEQYQPARDLSP